LRPVANESGDITAGVGVAQDITEQVVYREELERTNERLEQLTELVFHDIKNPLNIAQGRLEIVRKEVDNEHTERLAAALDRIESLTSRDTTLTGKVDKTTFETVSLETVAMGAWQNVATKSATLSIEIDQEVRGDGGDIRRMFENLFRNAVEHGGDDVTVTVGDDDIVVIDEALR
jgi:signal transduction histidine kinase